MAFDIRRYYNDHKDFYGDTPLEEVAKDAYKRGFNNGEPDFNTWRQSAGIDSALEEDRRLRNPTFEDKLRSKVDGDGNIVKSFLQGGAEGITTELPSMVGGALQFAGSHLPFKGIEKAGKSLKDWAEEKRQEIYGPEIERTGLDRIVYEGTKMLAPSIIPGGIAGTIARGAKGVNALLKAGKIAEATAAAKSATNIGAGAAAGLFGLSQAQQTKDTAEKEGVDPGLAPYATGTIEALGEFLGTKYLAKLFRLDEADVVKRGAGEFVKDLIKTLGVEVGTEIGQQGLEAGVEKYSGIRPNANPIMEAVDVIGPTAFMTILTGGLAGATNKLRSQDPEEKAATQYIEKLKAGAMFSMAINEGLTTGEYEGQPFSSDHAIEVIKEAQNKGVFDDTDIDRFKDKYPQLRDGLNGVIVENLTKKIDEAVTNTLTNTAQNLSDVPIEELPPETASKVKKLQNQITKQEDYLAKNANRKGEAQYEKWAADLEQKKANLSELTGGDKNGTLQTETTVEDLLAEQDKMEWKNKPVGKERDDALLEQRKRADQIGSLLKTGDIILDHNGDYFGTIEHTDKTGVTFAKDDENPNGAFIARKDFDSSFIPDRDNGSHFSVKHSQGTAEENKGSQKPLTALPETGVKAEGTNEDFKRLQQEWKKEAQEGKITAEEFGKRLVNFKVTDTPQSDKQAKSEGVAKILDDLDNTDLQISDAVPKLKSMDISDNLKVAIANYEKDVETDNTEYGKRSGLTEQAENNLRTAMESEALPAPLSQTDAATVGVTKDEAKFGESLNNQALIEEAKKYKTVDEFVQKTHGRFVANADKLTPEEKELSDAFYKSDKEAVWNKAQEVSAPAAGQAAGEGKQPSFRQPLTRRFYVDNDSVGSFDITDKVVGKKIAGKNFKIYDTFDEADQARKQNIKDNLTKTKEAKQKEDEEDYQKYQWKEQNGKENDIILDELSNMLHKHFPDDSAMRNKMSEAFTKYRRDNAAGANWWDKSLEEKRAGLKENIQAAYPHIERIGRQIWESGNQTREKWFAKMKEFLGDLWDKFKYLAREAWNKIREERGSISFEKKEGNERPVQVTIVDDVTPQKTIKKKTETKQTDPPVSRDPKVLNTYLKDETDAIVQTIMNKLHPKSMTWLETMLKSPEWFDHPQIQNIVKLFMRDRNEIYHETFNELNAFNDSTVTDAAKVLRNKGLSLTERLSGKVSPEYQKLMDMIDDGDTRWVRNTKVPLETQLKHFEDAWRKKGATDEIINVWRSFRQSYDKALDLMTKQLRDMIEEIKQEAIQKGEKPDLSELNQTLRGALAQMEEWRGFYAPRQRQGNWAVQAYKEHGPMSVNREWHRAHHGSELAAQREAKKLERDGWKIYKVGEVEKLPEDIYQDVKAVSTAKLIDTALDKLGKKSDLDTTAFNEEVLREVSNMIKSRGFRSTMIHRGSGNVVRGFIEDPIERHLMYINSVSGGISKARVARMAMNELLGDKVDGSQIGGIDPAKDPKAFSVAQDYIQEQLRNADASDRIIGLAKSIATFKFLGFNLRSLAVNTTAILTTAPAAIHQYATGGKGSFTEIFRELAKAGKDYGAVMAGKDLGNPDEAAFIADVHKKGWDDAQYTREALGEMSKLHNKAWAAAMDASMWAFGKSEQWNRGTTMLAAYRVARKQGLNHAEAADRAKTSSDKAHGVYGKSTMPMWAQGTNPAAKIGQMMYVYSKFGHNYLQMLYDMGFKQHNVKGAMFAFLSPLVLAGGAALPFKDAIFGLAGAILSLLGIDDDPEKWVWDQIREHLGGGAEKIGRHGLTGAMGVDISGSLSIGVGVPKDFIDLTGAIGGVATEIKEAGESLGRGQYSKAAEHILPTGFANPVRAYREAEEGVTTRNNRRVWNEKGRPYVPEEGATAARALGFRSTDQAVLSERTWEGHRQQTAFAEKRNSIYERYRAWLLGDRDREEYKEIVKEVQDFNAYIRRNRIRGESFITSQSLKNQVRRMQRPSRKERSILEE